MSQYVFHLVYDYRQIDAPAMTEIKNSRFRTRISSLQGPRVLEYGDQGWCGVTNSMWPSSLAEFGVMDQSFYQWWPLFRPNLVACWPVFGARQKACSIGFYTFNS